MRLGDIERNAKLPCGDDGSVDAGGAAWSRLADLLDDAAALGSAYSRPMVSTYALVYTVAGAYAGAYWPRTGASTSCPTPPPGARSSAPCRQSHSA